MRLADAPPEPGARAALFDQAAERTVELEMAVLPALIEIGRGDVGAILDRLAEDDPWDRRVDWYRGLAALAALDWHGAARRFEDVCNAFPGDLAPKLALAFATEGTGTFETAANLYEVISRTNPMFASAVFGLARCRLALGQRTLGIAAYDRIPETSHAFLDARMARARAVLTDAADLTHEQIVAVSDEIERLPLAPQQRAALVAAALEAALPLLGARNGPQATAPRAFGHPLSEREVRIGLERAYRDLARFAPSAVKRAEFVGRANRVRPWSLF
jgi:serine/threonine-protein kinase PknG